MTVFTRTWNASYEATPANGDDASEGAERIRDFKADVAERLTVDHSWDGDANDGMHNQVTFADPLADKPIQDNDETYLYSKDVTIEEVVEERITVGGTEYVVVAGVVGVDYTVVNDEIVIEGVVYAVVNGLVTVGGTEYTEVNGIVTVEYTEVNGIVTIEVVDYTVVEVVIVEEATKAELFFEDEDGDEIQITNSGLIASTASDFATGDKLLFPQATVPIGWTIDITHDNKALRLVSSGHSTGGGIIFTDTFNDSRNTGGTALMIQHLPSHTHTYVRPNYGNDGDSGSVSTSQNSTEVETDPVGGGSTHSHPILLDPMYVDVLIGVKD